MKNRIMRFSCQVIFRILHIFIENPIAKSNIGVYNDIKNFKTCYII